MKISVVVPVYGCHGCLQELEQRLRQSVGELTQDYEIILVDDYCPQDSWQVISELCAADERIKGVRLSRNHGQHYAITAGLDHADGDWIVVMDCDLQDVPEEIPNLYKRAQDGFDLVVAQRINRKDGLLKKTASRLFYGLLSYLTDTAQDASIANFGIYSRKVIDVIKRYREQNRMFPLFVKLVGFRCVELQVRHSERAAGKTTYNFNKMLNLAIDSIIAHSNKPLRLCIKFGFLVSASSALYAIYLVTRYMLYGSQVEGWSSVMVSMFIMFGLTFSMFGIIGLYVGKIFDEVKGRPLYIIDTTLNLSSPAVN